MPTPAQIEEQVQLERDAIRCGIERLYKDTAKAEAREYASSSCLLYTSDAADE